MLILGLQGLSTCLVGCFLILDVLILNINFVCSSVISLTSCKAVLNCKVVLQVKNLQPQRLQKLPGL